MLYQVQCRKTWGTGASALFLTCWFLLPVLFQTKLTFLSGGRLAWEAAYLALSILMVRQSRDLWTAGEWVCSRRWPPELGRCTPKTPCWGRPWFCWPGGCGAG